MRIKFSDGSHWAPKWENHLIRFFELALMVEKFNKKRTGKGDPEALLVNPIIQKLQSLGHLGGSLYRFDIEAKVQDTGVTLGSQQYLTSDNFGRAKKEAIRAFEDDILGRIQDTRLFKDKLLSITKIVVTEYVAKKNWEESITEGISF